MLRLMDFRNSVLGVEALHFPCGVLWLRTAEILGLPFIGHVPSISEARVSHCGRMDDLGHYITWEEVGTPKKTIDQTEGLMPDLGKL